MGMGTIAISGMQAAMDDMNIISNNIANVQTGGFKVSSANYADNYPATGASGNQIGLGVNLATVDQNFEPGNDIQDGIASHLSIAGGNGFFIVKDPTSGQVSYSRAGQFSFDPSVGYFLLGNQRLQGFPAVQNQIPPGSTATDLYINTAPIPAIPTTTITQNTVNLSSNDSVPSTATFSATNATSYNFSSPATIYDSLGNSNNATLYYVKSSTANNWSLYVSVNGTVVNSSSPATLTFNTDGSLNSSSGLTGMSFSPTTGAATPQTFALDMTGITQTAGIDNPGQYTWDGAPAGTYSKYSIDKDGKVTVVYTNGLSNLIGQVALANFSTPQNLQYLGQGSWASTPSAGTPSIKPANSTSNINSGSYEGSNVDMATELVQLINAQNFFQANAQVEQTYNQVMQTVTKL